MIPTRKRRGSDKDVSPRSTTGRGRLPAERQQGQEGADKHDERHWPKQLRLAKNMADLACALRGGET